MDLKGRQGIKGVEIPITLRALVYSGFRFPPLRQLGNSYYDYAARHSARLLQQTVPGTKIILFGGSVDRCVPGISDLDFLILKKTEFESQEIGDLRSAYFELKRKFPVLGEVHATINSSWEEFENSKVASRLWFNDRKRFEKGVWKRTRSRSRVGISRYSRFALCLHHFERAQRSLVQALRTPNAFYRANFVREISKVICWADTNEITLQSSFNPAAQMGLAFYQLELLAKRALKESFSPINDLHLEIPKAKGIRFVSEMVNRRWQEKFNAAGGILAKLKGTEAAAVFVCQQAIGLGASLALFQAYTEFLKKEFAAESLPYILSPEMHECASLGWNWGTNFPHLGWLSAQQTAGAEPMERCARHTFERLREQILLELNLIRGKLVCRSPEQVQRELFTLARALLAVHLQYITTDTETLIRKGEKVLPLTTLGLRETANLSKPLGLDRLFHHCIAVCREAKLAPLSSLNV